MLDLQLMYLPSSADCDARVTCPGWIPASQLISPPLGYNLQLQKDE